MFLKPANVIFGGTIIAQPFITVKVVCLSSDNVGDMVYIAGEQVSSDTYNVTRVDIDDPNKRNPLGMLIEKTSSTTGTVQIVGVIKGVYTGLTPGKYLFIDTAGRLNEVAPGRPSLGVTRSVQICGLAISSNGVSITLMSPTIIKNLAA